MPVRRHARTLFAALAIAAATALPNATALADSPDDYTLQSFGFSNAAFRNFFLGPPPVTPQQIRLYADSLDLSDEQTELALELQRDIAVKHRAAWTTLRETMSDIQHAQMRGDQEEMVELQEQQMQDAERFEQTVEELSDNFFDDLRLILSDSQEANWDAFERTRRRASTLAQHATYDDERLDLVAITASLELSAGERATLQPLIEEYATSLDTTLRVRNDAAETLAEKMSTHDEHQMSSWNNADPENFDWTAFQEKQQELARDAVVAAIDTRTAAKRVRDVNRRYLTLIEEQLPSHAVEQMRSIVGTERRSQSSDPFTMMGQGGTRAAMAFSMVEHLPALDTMLGAQTQMFRGGRSLNTLNTPPLTDEQQQGIEELREEFERRTTALNAKYARTEARNDDAQGLTVGFPGGSAVLVKLDDDGVPRNAFGMRGANPDPDSDEAKYNRELSELDQWAIDGLRQLLSLEQRAIFAHF